MPKTIKIKGNSDTVREISLWLQEMGLKARLDFHCYLDLESYFKPDLEVRIKFFQTGQNIDDIITMLSLKF